MCCCEDPIRYCFLRFNKLLKVNKLFFLWRKSIATVLVIISSSTSTRLPSSSDDSSLQTFLFRTWATISCNLCWPNVYKFSSISMHSSYGTVKMVDHSSGGAEISISGSTLQKNPAFAKQFLMVTGQTSSHADLSIRLAIKRSIFVFFLFVHLRKQMQTTFFL